MNEIEGKVALVTGGSRGIGAAVALRLAEHGADVVLTYEHRTERASSVVDGIKDIGRRALAIRADSADVAAVTADGPNADTIRGFTALGHYAEPGDIAATVAFLAGHGGRYITGATINVDGGFTV